MSLFHNGEDELYQQSLSTNKIEDKKIKRIKLSKRDKQTIEDYLFVIVIFIILIGIPILLNIDKFLVLD